MKYCKHCGHECDSSRSICPTCGALIDNYIDNKQYMDIYHGNKGKRIFNKKLILWFLLGLFLPFPGFIICLCIRADEPDRAKAISIGIITSIVISIIFSFVFRIIGYFWIPEENENIDNGEQIKVILNIINNKK